MEFEKLTGDKRLITEPAASRLNQWHEMHKLKHCTKQYYTMAQVINSQIAYADRVFQNIKPKQPMQKPAHDRENTHVRG